MKRSYVKIVEKGWGREEWIENSPLYCAKLLTVREGKKCSLHFHEKKFETFHILQGTIELELEGEKIRLVCGDIVDVRPYQKHRFLAMSCGTTILEVSTQHFESDSIRIEKGD